MAMKTHHWIIIAVLITGSALLIINTGDIEPRIDQQIDLNWKFFLGDDDSFSALNYDDGAWEYVSLPHDWMIRQEVKKDHKSGTAGGFYPAGVGWYRKYVDLSDYGSREQFYLVFDGVYMNADVWVNGHHAGEHRYGYIGFHYDISEFLVKDTINVIAVRTDCRELPADRWYSGAGIYRHVKLIATDKLHFPVLNSRITQSVKEDQRIVRSEIDIVNNERRTIRFKIRSDLLAPDGSLIGSSVSSRTIKGRSRMTVTEEHPVPDPVLWSDKDPALYEIKSFLIYKKKISDHLSTKFGIRDITFSPDSGFILNGNKVWLKGVCIHHDGGALGSAVPDATWEYRLKKLRELGVNAIRLAHNPHSPELLDMCDRMGFLVIGEMYDKWEEKWDGANEGFDFENTYEDDLAYFIRRDFNHPSVIAWSVGNETIEQLEDPEEGVEWYQTLSNLVKSIDSTRMVTCGLHPGYAQRENEIPSSYIRVEPLVSYNYRTDSMAAWHWENPNLIWLASETKAYNENRRSGFENISYLDNSWMDMKPFVAGQFIWAGIDYYGESPGWPHKSFYNGLLKTSGEIKPYAYYTQSIYSDQPMVKIAVVDKKLVDSLNNSTNWQLPWSGAPVVRHWNFTDNGNELQVIIYSNCPEVELTLNDSLLNQFARSNFDDGVIKTSVRFKPGTILAKATFRDTNGEVIYVRDSLITAGPPGMILMKPDRHEFIADGKDVVHIETRVTDSIGITSPGANHTINYKLSGPGKIKVIDNGNPVDSTIYGAHSAPVYEGTQLLIVQSTLEPGDLIISATTTGLESSEVKIKSVAPDYE